MRVKWLCLIGVLLSVFPLMLAAQEDSTAAIEAAATAHGWSYRWSTTAEDNALELQPFLSAALRQPSLSRKPEDAREASDSSSRAGGSAPIVREQSQNPRFHWKPALVQSAQFLVVMHAFRLATEEFTRQELGGPFWSDYFDSVRGYGGWSDGDTFIVNYVGHQLEGSVAGFIYVQNDDRSRALQFGKSGEYWKSRLKATAWAAAFSLQFEFGPVSEASIGNVGRLARPDGGSYMGNVDIIMTPVIGFASMVAEDALDRYTIPAIERRTGNRVVRALVRGFLNPGRSFANVMRGKLPWHRDNRPLRGSAQPGMASDRLFRMTPATTSIPMESDPDRQVCNPSPDGNRCHAE